MCQAVAQSVVSGGVCHAGRPIGIGAANGRCRAMVGIEALDYQFLGNRVQEERPDLDMLPSEYFARNIYACYWFEQTAPSRLIDKVGVDNILFETDFPHPTSLYGDEVHKRIKGGLSTCGESVQR